MRHTQDTIRTNNMQSRSAFAFNKLLAGFVLWLKKEAPALKDELRAHYRVIEFDKDDHVRFAADALAAGGEWRSRLTQAAEQGAGTEREDLAGLPLLRTAADGCLTLGRVAELLSPDAQDELLRHVYTLAVVAILHDDYTTDGGQQLLEHVLRVLKAMQDDEQKDVDDGIEGVLDDDARALLERLRTLYAELPPELLQDAGSETGSAGAGAGSAGAGAGSAGAGAGSTGAGAGSAGAGAGSAAEALQGEFPDLQKLLGSKIGKLAAEITSEIDPSQLGDVSANPAEMLDFAKLADPNNPMGNIIGKVGAKIQDKIRTGELNQAELMTEAFSMLQMFDKKNLLGGLMAAAGGHAKGRPSSSRRRTRHA